MRKKSETRSNNVGALTGAFVGAMMGFNPVGAVVGTVLGSAIGNHVADYLKLAGNDQERVIDLLNDHEMTQAEIADALNVSPSTVGRWYNGQTVSTGKSKDLQHLYEKKQIDGAVVMDIKCYLVDRTKLDKYFEQIRGRRNKLAHGHLEPSNVLVKREFAKLMRFAIVSKNDNLQSAQINDGDVLIIHREEFASGDENIVIGSVYLILHFGFYGLYRVYKRTQDGSKLLLKNDVEEKVCDNQDVKVIGQVVNIIKGTPAPIAP